MNVITPAVRECWDPYKLRDALDVAILVLKKIAKEGDDEAAGDARNALERAAEYLKVEEV